MGIYYYAGSTLPLLKVCHNNDTPTARKFRAYCRCFVAYYLSLFSGDVVSLP